MENSEINLGRLEQIADIREVWKHEAENFTPWLAEEDNIKLLGDTIGMELEVQKVEKAVGPFSADILCVDLESDSYVLIENQLEKTDHKHLGQLMTYAAGLEAVTIVWIADSFTDEHRAALDWLNDKTSDDLNFFGLEIELWKIANSPIAPKFNIVSKPNEWTHYLKESVASGELSDIKRQQLKFWTAFRQFMTSNSLVKATKPRPQHWMTMSIGRSGFKLYGIAKTKPNEIRIDFKISNRVHFELLEEEREQIDKELGGDVEWKVGKRQKSRLIIVRNPLDIFEEKQWNEGFEWLRDKLNVYHRTFANRIRNLDADEYVEPDDDEIDED